MLWWLLLPRLLLLLLLLVICVERPRQVEPQGPGLWGRAVGCLLPRCLLLPWLLQTPLLHDTVFFLALLVLPLPSALARAALGPAGCTRRRLLLLWLLLPPLLRLLLVGLLLLLSSLLPQRWLSLQLLLLLLPLLLLLLPLLLLLL